MTDINYSTLPAHMQEGARLYIEKGISGGSFSRALFSNDLIGAFSKPDEENTAAMLNWVRFLYNVAPVGCYGSPEHHDEWCKAGGLEGIERARAAQVSA